MIAFSLQSGSNGNSIYVEAGDARLLFDAGISGLQAQQRMASKQRDIRECDALIISHDHTDHTRCAGVYQRKFRIPIYVTRRAYQAVRWYWGEVWDVRPFVAGKPIEIGGVTVHTIPTPHDGIDSVCFVIEHSGKKLGIFTDLGHPFTALGAALAEVDAAYLESNYDPEMLRNGPYPEVLKRRISGANGHLSNEEAADMVRRCVGGRLQWLSIAHLSQHNNRPDIALDAHRSLLGRSLPLYVAGRDGVGDTLEV